MRKHALGQVIYSFFVDHLQTQRQLRPTSIQSYRDGMRLFLAFVAADAGRKITRLSLSDLTFDRVLGFLRHLEEDRHNHIRTRNQRLAMLHGFFEYIATSQPEILVVSERVAAIPTKRVAPPDTHYLEKEEVESLFSRLPLRGTHAARDRALLLFLYNTGARVQEVADLRTENLDLGPQPRAHLHGKGDKWRVCPLWPETTDQVKSLIGNPTGDDRAHDPVFRSRQGDALTRSGIYKIVRRHTSWLDRPEPSGHGRKITPHVFRHTTAVHLLEAGVDVNVIRGWLGHVSLDTTNRYAEITAKAKEAALRCCEVPSQASAGFPRAPVWRNDESLLQWLGTL
jgi:integrase/recombinase XerD